MHDFRAPGDQPLLIITEEASLLKYFIPTIILRHNHNFNKILESDWSLTCPTVKKSLTKSCPQQETSDNSAHLV